jgi:hypothetical protein
LIEEFASLSAVHILSCINEFIVQYDLSNIKGLNTIILNNITYCTVHEKKKKKKKKGEKMLGGEISCFKEGNESDPAVEVADLVCSAHADGNWHKIPVSRTKSVFPPEFKGW